MGEARKRRNKERMRRMGKNGSAIVTDGEPEAVPAVKTTPKAAAKVKMEKSKPAPEPSPWTRKDLLVFGGSTLLVLYLLLLVVQIIQPPISGSTLLITSLIGFLLLPGAPLAIAFIAAAAFVAAPLVYRVHPMRRLRFFETIAYAAVLTFCWTLLAISVASLAGASGVTTGNVPGTSVATPLPKGTQSAAPSPVATATPHASATKPSTSTVSTVPGFPELTWIEVGLLVVAMLVSLPLSALVFPSISRMLRSPERKPAFKKK